jgi:hypothetical protein
VSGQQSTQRTLTPESAFAINANVPVVIPIAASSAHSSVANFIVAQHRSRL